MSSATYNPYYIPSLDAMKAQARQEAEAQINATVGALPTDKFYQDQSAMAGRDLKGFDQSFIDFLAKQRTSSLANVAPPTYAPNGGVAGTANTDTTSATARDAGAASAMLGIGFASQQEALQSAAAGGLDAHQSANRRSLNDALMQVAQQRSAERAKQPALEQDILGKKKQDAFNAYTAFLNNQLAAATAGATASFNQGKLDISQQNADTSAQNANTRAGAASPEQKAADKKAADMKKAKGIAYDKMDSAIHSTIDGNPTSVSTWTVQVDSINPSTGAHTLTSLPAKDYPAGTTMQTVLDDFKAQYPGKTLHAINNGNKVVPGAKIHYTYDQIYNIGYKRLRSAGYTVAQAKKLTTAYLKGAGIKAPSAGATSSASR